MFKKRYYVHQLDETDCGAAALAMIFKYYHSDISIAKIRGVAQTDKSGTTALGLINAAEHFKLKTQAIKTDISFFKSNDRKEILVPFIAHINKNHGLLHYVVVLKVRKDDLVIADPDPSIGITKLTYTEFAKIWTGIAVFMAPGPTYVNIKDNNDSLWQTAKLLLKQKQIIATVVISTFLSTFITIVGALFLQKIVDSYVIDGMTTTLTTAAICLFFAYVFHGIFNYFQGYLSTILGQRLSIDVLLSYILHLFKLPVSFFETRKTGEITSRFSDANNIILTLARTAIATLLNFGTIIVIGIVLMVISMKLFLLSMISVPIYAAIIFSFYKLFEKWNNESMEQNALLSSQMIEDLHGIESIKSLNIENKMYDTIDTRFVKTLKADYAYSIASVTQAALKDVAELVITLAILYFGSLMAIKGQISLGQLVAFNSLMGYFLGPVEAIINLQNDLQNAKVANKRLNQVLLAPVEEKQKCPMALRENDLADQIEFSKVSFEYKYGQSILKNINLKIKRNESVAIVGFSGSGKTTLAKLLVNFYKPITGKVLINGQDIRFVTQKDLRNYVTYLPQTPFIFSGSVIENIALGLRKTPNMETIIRAARLAEIHKDIEKLPNGYMTNLSENSGLSGGQMQRIAVARAIISDAPVMIFDESTSNLDLLTEKRILNNLMGIKNKTLIFIAHRLEVARKADRIIVMNDGQIIENGTHKDLINEHGNYYQLLQEA
ncbi:peptide cleavage/export ABC transporter [Lentilactobacillus hilgardii]|nr:peptide cleavage/export ABC transporter [Lentilactobacillus hilgardii]MCV3740204.1 peptide cleavage/export ABC transporter [Lentilactobacillus hilgardii]